MSSDTTALLIERDELEQKLRTQIMEVTFNKVNGDERVMTCTLQEGVIPAATKKDPLSLKKIREVNPEVVSVWDTNATGWRSFRVANVTDVNEVA